MITNLACRSVRPCVRTAQEILKDTLKVAQEMRIGRERITADGLRGNDDKVNHKDEEKTLLHIRKASFFSEEPEGENSECSDRQKEVSSSPEA
jgi:hypothetical protein